MNVSATAQLHPLDPLSEDELRAAVELVRRDRGLGETARFVSVTLREPEKAVVRGHRLGQSVVREAELIVLDRSLEAAFEGTVSLTEGETTAWRRLEGVQPAILPEEYEDCERLVRDHPEFRAALARRGITELELVTVDPVPAATYEAAEGDSRRLCAALAWMRATPGGNSYGRPIEGIVGLVDLNKGEVVRIVDNGVVPLPDEPGEYRASHLGPLRADVKPLEIVQPEGSSFAVEGNEVRWQRWSFRVGFTAREGLVLHELYYDDAGRRRPILYRASYSEMAVPYGDPSPNRYLQCPFDIGENLVGTLANSLELGCDCLGTIHYFDAVVADSRGEPVRKRNAICLHEEDYGILWKHWDFRTGDSEVRRSRRLVISSISTVGNYEYGFYWYLYQDGTIESEVKATGILSTAAVLPGELPEHGALVAPGVNGMNHQHFFNVRLDFDLDGERNSVYEVQTEAAPLGPNNPYGNAFKAKRTLLRRESESPALIDPLHGRHWLIVNHASRNALDQPVAYKLVPGENVVSFAQPGSVFAKRGAFASKHVWVTRYDPSERYAAGDYPNQNRELIGLPAYVTQDRSLEDQDIVLWYTFGLHHLPRPEDWPVMPCAYIGFTLKPVGFFNRNPALDVPPPHRNGDSCAHHA
jgi:primary-amine oxidase